MYDVIVLGATFASAGIARECKDRCLVIEQSAQAGGEFTSALSTDPNGGSHLYRCFEESEILFCTKLVSLEKIEEGFLCTTHGVNGFRTHKAKRVIDTRCNDAMCLSKTYNLLIESNEEPDNLKTPYTAGNRNHTYLLRCTVPLSCGYGQAREEAARVMERFSGTQRLIFSANAFDYQVKPGYPKTENGILYLPSKAYESPSLAFEAGVSFGKEVAQ